MKKTIRRGFLLALVPLGILELLVRTGALAPTPSFAAFENALQMARDHKIAYIFVGSSRVAEAIRPATFSRIVLADGATESAAVNLGRGYSTLAEDYLALERLYDAEGTRAAGATVFIEAPQGLPVFSTFRDPWVHPNMPELIVPVLTPRDALRLWTESSTPAADRLEVTARYALGSIDYIAHLRARISASGPRLAHRLAVRLIHRGVDPDADAAAVDLDAVGGIVATGDGVARARRLALLDDTMREVTAATNDERPVQDWSSTILFQLNRLVQAHGGTVVAFDMPVSSFLRRPYETSTRRADATRFLSEAAAAGITFVTPAFATTDDDFPDYWHLRASRADAFTASLAAAYLCAVPRSERAHARDAASAKVFATSRH